MNSISEAFNKSERRKLTSKHNKSSLYLKRLDIYHIFDE
jgi:hypothetical protein